MQAGGVGRWNPLRSRPVNSADSAASVSDEPRLLLRAYFAAPDASAVGPACLRGNRREGRRVYYRLADTHVRMLLDVCREHTGHEGIR